jgi:hypothetical protein
LTFDANFGDCIDLASLVQTDDALSASASNTRAESCLLQDYVEDIGQSGSHICLLHMIHMRTSGYCGQRIRRLGLGPRSSHISCCLIYEYQLSNMIT